MPKCSTIYYLQHLNALLILPEMTELLVQYFALQRGISEVTQYMTIFDT